MVQVGDSREVPPNLWFPFPRFSVAFAFLFPTVYCRPGTDDPPSEV